MLIMMFYVHDVDDDEAGAGAYFFLLRHSDAHINCALPWRHKYRKLGALRVSTLNSRNPQAKCRSWAPHVAEQCCPRARAVGRRR